MAQKGSERCNCQDVNRGVMNCSLYPEPQSDSSFQQVHKRLAMNCKFSLIPKDLVRQA